MVEREGERQKGISTRIGSEKKQGPKKRRKRKKHRGTKNIGKTTTEKKELRARKIKNTEVGTFRSPTNNRPSV